MEDTRDLRFLKQQQISEKLTIDHYGKAKMGEKWNYDDAHHQRKRIASWVIELNYGTRRGGVIIGWRKANADDIRRAMNLPHTFKVSEDEKYSREFEAHFGDYENALHEYKNLKTVRDIINLWSRN